jgi:ABC-type amino acid transport substrate-binding protein
MDKRIWRGIIVILLLITFPLTYEHLRHHARLGRLIGQESFPDGVMRVGVNPNQAPYAFYDEDGTLSGLEIGLAFALGDSLDVEVALVPIGYDSMFDALSVRLVDMVIARVQPEQVWNAQAKMTSHYFDAGLVLVNQQGWRTMRDVARQSLGYVLGGQGDLEARRWLRRIQSFDMVAYDTGFDVLDAVRTGVIPAGLVDMETVQRYLRDYPDWMPDYPYVTHVPYVIALDDERPRLVRQVSTALDRLHKQGMIDDLIEKWMAGYGENRH